MPVKRIRWHAEADVVVVGYGCAGAVAAITASDTGAQVAILEKQEAKKHISTSFMSGAVFICPSDVQRATHYMEAMSKVSDDLCWTEPDIFHVWAQYAVENKKWIESIGGRLELRIHGGEHELPGTESMDVYQVRGRGARLMRLFADMIKARGIQVMYDTPADELLTNSKGEVIGVKAKQGYNKEEVINIRARRAVILTTGGFEFNEEMKLQYLKVYPCYFGGSMANTGDGILMALGVGAQLWHMNCCSSALVMKFPEIPYGILVSGFGGKGWRMPGESVLPGFSGKGWGPQRAERLADIAGYIMVDRDGKRYTNENIKPHTVYYELACFDSYRMLYPRIPSYWIFDQKRMNDSPLSWRSGATGIARFYKWSSDNMVELERGWIKRGDTVKELALRLGIEPRTLVQTVDNYNRYCEHGQDTEFNRIPETLVPLANPPYYAVELWPGGPNTQGGPRRNSKAQVLKADGSVVPRLYCAGELGSIYGMLYPVSGGNLAECIVFGRIAGEHASEQLPL